MHTDRPTTTRPDPAGPPASPSALGQLHDALPGLNPTMRRVAEAILADPTAAGSCSITTLAREAEASPAAVSRLAGRLGYAGFPALRSAIATENGRSAQSGWERDIGGAITPEDSARDVLDILAGTAARALREAAAAIDVDQAERAARAIARADRVHLYGEWGDAIAVHELYIRLLRIGVSAWFHDAGPNTVHAVCNTLTSRDVVLVLSRSGADELPRTFVRCAREHDATTIALHGAPECDLATEADIPVFTGLRNGTVWTQNFAGRTSDVLVASYLWMLVAQRRAADDSMRYIADGTFPDADRTDDPTT
jgi:DNA-binding MurR/RpiR family transcriptional regulator